MKVELVTVDQSYSLSTNKVDNFAIFRLGDGSVVRAAIDEEATVSIIRCASSSGAELTNAPMFAIEPPPQEEISHLVAWADLPDSEVPRSVKNILGKINAPAELSLEDIEAVVASVLGGESAPKEPAPRKRVMSNSAGYPVGVTPDLGEVGPGVDLDEDGVGQL